MHAINKAIDRKSWYGFFLFIGFKIMLYNDILAIVPSKCLTFSSICLSKLTDIHTQKQANS